jgi:hypothetical protein
LPFGKLGCKLAVGFPLIAAIPAAKSLTVFSHFQLLAPNATEFHKRQRSSTMPTLRATPIRFPGFWVKTPRDCLFAAAEMLGKLSIGITD